MTLAGQFRREHSSCHSASDPIGDEDIEGELHSVARRGKVLAVLALVAVLGCGLLAAETKEAKLRYRLNQLLPKLRQSLNQKLSRWR